ncbi:MAG: hypothetical protein AAGJ81_15930 [Verrucomicrobiota bacterium]
MIKQAPSKVDSNPLRQQIIAKGHSVRSAARELGINIAEMCHKLDACADPEAFAARIAALPKRETSKMKTLRRPTRRGTKQKTKATA